MSLRLQHKGAMQNRYSTTRNVVHASNSWLIAKKYLAMARDLLPFVACLDHNVDIAYKALPRSSLQTLVALARRGKIFLEVRCC